MSEQGFTISPWAFRDLTYMFSDPILVDQLLLTDEKQVAKYKKVNKDGSITLGKTSISWLNRLFGGEYVLNPETICLRLIKIITGMGSGRNDDAYKDILKANAKLSAENFRTDIVADEWEQYLINQVLMKG